MSRYVVGKEQPAGIRALVALYAEVASRVGHTACAALPSTVNHDNGPNDTGRLGKGPSGS
jgi:hypothetical protein